VAGPKLTGTPLPDFLKVNVFAGRGRSLGCLLGRSLWCVALLCLVPQGIHLPLYLQGSAYNRYEEVKNEAV